MLVELRFHGQLNDLLAAVERGRLVHRSVRGVPAVKDVIESIGVPHVEVGAVIAGGRPVTLDAPIPGDSRVHVYPPGHPILRWLACGGSEPETDPRPARFVVDGHLGRLAAYLRMLGFDTLWSADATDDVLAELAGRDDRILLSRDRGLLKRTIVHRGHLVRSDRPHEQLREIVDRYGLAGESRPFGRCLSCNGLLEPVGAAIAGPLVPPRVAREQEEFRRCAACGGLYWRGSHHRRMVELIRTVLPEVRLVE
jgi:uncharacterized protein with PIN domain